MNPVQRFARALATPPPPENKRNRAFQGGEVSVARLAASLGGALLLLALGFAAPAALAQTAQFPQDFDTLNAAGNTDSAGLWSDSTTMWVADDTNDKIYAYNMATKARDTAKDFDTLQAAGNTVPGGLWSDSTTMWVVDSSGGKIYAYNLATKARDAAKDFDTLTAAGNANPYGLWSNNTTMWVVDNTDEKVYAYDLASKARTEVPLPTVQITADDADKRITEGADAVFTLARSNAPATALSIALDVSQIGTYAAAAGATSATIAASQSTAKFTVGTSAPSANDGHGSITVSLGTGTDWTSSTTANSDTVLVLDDDGPRLRLSSPVTSFVEGSQPSITLTVSVTNSVQFTSTADNTVDYRVTQSGGQWVQNPGTVRSFGFALNSNTDVFSISIANNTQMASGQVVVALYEAAYSALPQKFSIDPAGAAVTITIVDDDLPQVSISADDPDSSVAEGDPVVFTVSSMNVPSGGLNVPVTLSQMGNYIAGGTGPRTVRIPGGQTSAKLTVRTDDDNTDEDDGSITATLGTLPATHRPGTMNSATVAVTDDEALPRIMEPGTVQVADTADYAVVRLRLVPASGAARGPVTDKTASIAYLTIDGSAKAGVDYTAHNNVILTFHPPNHEARISVALLGPDADEDVDDFSVSIYSIDKATAFDGSCCTAITVQIVERPSFSISGSADAVSEAAGSATLTVSISLPQPVPLTVPVTADDGDGNVLGSVPPSVTILANSMSALLNIPLDNDSRDEADSTSVTVTIALPENSGDAYALGTSQATFMVTDDDDEPSVSVVPGARGNEGRDLTFLVRLSAPSEKTVTVQYAVAAGTATEGEDYTKPTATELVFQPNVVELPVRVATLPDEVDDPDETVTLTLTGMPTNAAIGVAMGEGVIVEGLDPDQIRALNEAILPHIASAVGEETGLAIQDRVRAGFSGAAPQQRLPAPLQAMVDAPVQTLAGMVQSRPAYGLHDLDFALHFDGSARGLSESEGGAPAGFGLWGRGFFRDLSVDNGAIEFDGEVTGVMLGGDTRMGQSLLGLALSHTLAEVDWDNSDFTGSHETALTGVHPYFGWQNSHGVIVWGSLGYAQGEAELTEDERADFLYKRDIALRTAAFGAYGPLLERGSLSLGMMADASHTRLEETGIGSDDEVARTAVSARWLRAGLTFGWDGAQAGGAGMSANAEVALRRDFDDAKSGKGVEVGGGFAYSTAGGLRLNVDARYLAAHDADVDEFGVSGSVAYAASAAGQGFTFTFRPEWGAIQSAKEALWNGAFSAVPTPHPRGLRPLATPPQGSSYHSPSAPVLSYALEVKYGIPVLQGRELLTVFARTNLHAAASAHAWGADFNLGQHFSTGLETVLRPEASEPSDHRAYLRYHRAF